MNKPFSPSHNMPEYTVSDIAGAIKQQVEDRFGYVRVRGEITGWKLAASGHAYFRLKDEGAVLDAVIWKSTLARMQLKPEDGLEVLVSGRITTYPGKSSYQIVCEKMEAAGAGALMALLEARKKKLAAEGLFDAACKKPIPYLPETIGVITSPTGAVIRDILHRLEDRFPCRVIVWPVLVQGEQAAEQIAAAIAGFNAFPAPLPRPDLLIVARGGGSLEDLWVFNEEIVVRAAAMSDIPLISAVGHETDTTLIDFASCKRAPTPTAAAEMAVPVKSELEQTIRELNTRLSRAMLRELQHREHRVEGFARGLPKPERLLEAAMQRLDLASERLHCALPMLIERRFEYVLQLTARLPNPLRGIDTAMVKLNGACERLQTTLPIMLMRKSEVLSQFAARLNPQLLLRDIRQQQKQLQNYAERMGRLISQIMARKEEALRQHEWLLKTVSFERTLQRGFALVKSSDGKLLTNAEAARDHDKMSVQFADGKIRVTQETT